MGIGEQFELEKTGRIEKTSRAEEEVSQKYTEENKEGLGNVENKVIKTRKVLPSVIEKCSECPYCHTKEIVKQAYSYTSTTCCLAPTTVKTFWNGIPDNCPLPNETTGYTCK